MRIHEIKNVKASEEFALSVTIDGVDERINLEEIPLENNLMIRNSMEDITQGLQMKEVVTNLDNAAGLMFVAYAALGGTKIQAKMSGLQKDLLDLCDDSLTSITGFQVKSFEIANYIIRAYKWLLKGKEETAVKQFARCADCANEMAKKSEELADGFKQIGTKVEVALEDTQVEESVQYDRMDQLKEELKMYTAQMEGQKVLQEQLKSSIDEINAIYEEAKETEKSLLKKQEGFNIANMVIQGLTTIGTMISPITTLVASSKNQEPEQSQSQEKAKAELDSSKKELKEKEKELSEAKKEADQHIKEQTALLAEIEAFKKQIEELNSKEEQDEETLANISELETSLDEKNLELQKVESSLNQVSSKAKDYSEEIKAINESISQLSAMFDKMVAANQTAADKAASEKKEALTKKLELEAQNSNALADIKKFTLMIQAGAEAENTAKTAVETLHVAVRCIKQIIVALSNAALFWKSMEEYCRSLASAAVLKEIKDVQEDCNAEERVKYYKEASFMFEIAQYLSRWVALYYVCGDYLDGTRKVRGKIGDNIMAAPTREEGWKLAPQLAGEMTASITAQIDEAESKVTLLQEAI